VGFLERFISEEAMEPYCISSPLVLAIDSVGYVAFQRSFLFSHSKGLFFNEKSDGTSKKTLKVTCGRNERQRR
jgi:hypothetical protein